MDKSILKFENISYQYPDGTIALNNITLSVEQGKKIALLGNNGAGKSTLFLLFNGILKPTNGSIYFNGQELSHKRSEIRQIRQKIGVVFQNPDSQLFSSNVYNDIKFGPKNLGMSPADIEKAVTKAMILTETESFKDIPPHFLSIGQKKRVAIAGIIAMNPEIIVLDEPTAGLDPYYAKKIMRILDDLHNEKRTIILSTHDVNFAYEWADEIILMNNGNIVKQGIPEKVFVDISLVQQCNLEQPWIIELYQELIQKKLIPDSQPIPKTKYELFQLIK